jgi:hypothetical protein
VVSLKDDHIHGDSIEFLVMNLHQLELIRILNSKSACELTPDIIESTMQLIGDEDNTIGCQDTVPELLKSQRIGRNCTL